MANPNDREGGNPYPCTDEIDIETWEVIVPQDEKLKKENKQRLLNTLL